MLLADGSFGAYPVGLGRVLGDRNHDALCAGQSFFDLLFEGTARRDVAVPPHTAAVGAQQAHQRLDALGVLTA